MEPNLTELREKRDTLSQEVAAVFEAAKSTDGNKPGYDFQKVGAEEIGEEIAKLEGFAKAQRVSEWVQKKTAELDEVSAKLEPVEKAEAEAKAWGEREKQIKRLAPFPNGGGNGNDAERRTQTRSFGKQITEHATFKLWKQGSMDGKIVLPDVGLRELKALFQTTAGWEPESLRIGRVVDAVTRPLQILDILPTGQTGMANVVYMEETTRTHASAEVAEGAAKPESTFELTEQSVAVREIADFVPVTDIQLEDVPMVESYLDGRLRFGIMQRLDGQSVEGDGVAPNILGILNTPDIQDYALVAPETLQDAIFKAGMLVRVNGRANPTHVLLNSLDWQTIRLAKDDNGAYLWGPPSDSGPARIWGWPIVLNDVLPTGSAGQALIGSFEPAWITLFERRGVVVERGFINDQFRQNRQSIRASMRAALVVFRPPAFATVTFPV